MRLVLTAPPSLSDGFLGGGLVGVLTGIEIYPRQNALNQFTRIWMPSLNGSFSAQN